MTGLTTLAQRLAPVYHATPRSTVGDDDGLSLRITEEIGEELSLDQVRTLRRLMEEEIDKFPKVVIYVRGGVVQHCIGNDERLRVWVVDEDVAVSIQDQNQARKGADDCQFVVFPDLETSRQERRKALEVEHGQVWDSRQFRADFEFIAVENRQLVVRRRVDGVEGTLGTSPESGFCFDWCPKAGE